MKKLGLSVLLFCIFVGGALWIVLSEEDDFVLVRPEISERVPAALHDAGELRKLQGSIVKAINSSSFWSHLSVENQGEESLISIPHIAVKDSKGNLNLACLVYDRVTLIFEAEGQATSGARPSLKVSIPCEFRPGDPSRLDALTIPFSEVLSQAHPAEEFTLESRPGYIFQVVHFDGSWPRTWVLVEAQLDGSGGDTKNLKAPLPTAGGRPIFMVW